MPGHKRNGKYGITGSEFDITEIEGFDNLHSPDGVLLDIENRLTEHYGSEKSFMLINGSTVGILAAIFTLCEEGDSIIIARNCHKSVFSACCFRHLKVTFAEPEFNSSNGFYKRISQSTIDKAVKKSPNAKAVVITSPTYEGYISEVSCDIPLIVDAAHGAHLGIEPFPAYPKGDIVISSLHKTLPALTQTAVANIYDSNLVYRYKLMLDLLQTSSPSYLLMSSVEKCTDYLSAHSDDYIDYYSLLSDVRSTPLMWLKILDTDDVGKIVVSTANANINGARFADMLRKNYNIEPESAGAEHVILITSVADTSEAFKKLCAALREIDRACDKKSGKVVIERPPCTAEEFEISRDGKSAECELGEAVGRRANEFIYAYPPDIPIVVPNEPVTEETVRYINHLMECRVNVISDSGLLPKVLTKAD